MSPRAHQLLTVQTLFRGGCVSAIEKALIKALVVREDELCLHLLHRFSRGDENALPALKEMINELTSAGKRQ